MKKYVEICVILFKNGKHVFELAYQTGALILLIILLLNACNGGSRNFV